MKKSLVLVLCVLSAVMLILQMRPSVETLPTGEDLVEVRADDRSPTTQKKKTEIMSQHEMRVKGVIAKDRPDLFAEFHRDIRTRDGDPGPAYPPNYQIKALLKARNLSGTHALSKASTGGGLDWIERGPGNVSGRTRGIIVDPDDPSYNTWFAGSVGGGVWKTTDAGQTWTNLTPNLPNLATSTLVMAPSNHDVIYAGTGEGFGNVDQIDGSGIWKSEDRGQTWEQLASTADNPEFQNIMRMVVDPSDENTLVVATAPGFHYLNGEPNSGIFRSIDGGETWARVHDSGSDEVEHLIANPLNFNTQFATVNSEGVVKSIDGGRTWFPSTTGISEVGRMEIAIAPSDTTRLYISAQDRADTGTGSILFVSEDAGATWGRAQDVDGDDVHWLAGQGWYDNTIAVNPFDADQVFVGGVNLWRLDIQGRETIEAITGVDQENTESFLSFVNFGGRYAGGGLETGENFHGLETNVTMDEYTSVEIRFGPGKSQKAHRFIFGSNFQYPYQDYVDVPFEVWDIDNNQQLMASFRDHENNGVYELEDRFSDESSGGIDREYLFVHAVSYDAGQADPNIAQTAGQAYKNTYAMWPEAPAGAGVVDLTTLSEDATVRINWGELNVWTLNTTNVTDGYGEFGGSTKGVHVDHHNIVLIPTNEATQSFRLVNANDGGVAFSDDGGQTFDQPIDGKNTTQFYGVDKRNGADRYIGGTQDNGTWVSPSNPDRTSSWVDAPSGDGFEAVWHYGDPNKLLESSQFNNVWRSLDGGQTWTYISAVSGLDDRGGGSAPFFTKLAKSKQDPDLVFAMGRSGVWRTDNFASSWTLIPMPSEDWEGTRSFAQVKISLADPQIVWTGSRLSESRSLYVSQDGGVTFSETNTYDTVPMGRITGLETHPTDANTAYALFSFAGAPKVLRTTDLGQTWEDISGFAGANSRAAGSADPARVSSSNGFPDVAVFSLLVMPYNTDIIWAGTEIGLFESTDGGASWHAADNGLAATAIWEMLIVNDEVVAATHGRGIWTVALPELAGYEPPPAILAPRFLSIGGGAGGFVNMSVALKSSYDSTFVQVDGVNRVKLPGNPSPKDTSLTLALSPAGLDTVDISLMSYKDGRTFINAPAKIPVFPLAETQVTYKNDLNSATGDFLFSGDMEVRTEAGFDDGAIHTAHPYPDDTELVALLIVPIEVASEKATLTYDDIAIVEPGSGGSRFGDLNFWDFVVVEGSNDFGASWMPLADGYDARYDQVWEDAYDSGDPGDPSMFRSHEIDLLDTFSAGETVLIRFRLFADSFVNGWGWVIDNIAIQEEAVSVSAGEALPRTFSLSQNFPNPFNPSTQIAYALPRAVEVTLSIYNIRGQKVRDLVDGEKQVAGYYTVTWDGTDAFGRSVATGVYLYRIEAGEFVKAEKMTLIK